MRKYFEKRCKELDLNFNENQEPKIKKARFDDIEENSTSHSEDDEGETQKRR